MYILLHFTLSVTSAIFRAVRKAVHGETPTGRGAPEAAPAPPRKRAKKAQDKDDTRDAPHEKRHARGAPRRRTPVQHQRNVDVILFLALRGSNHRMERQS